jgi:hypothetical protein
MSPLLMSLIAFAIIFAGALLGMFIRSRLPRHHLTGDTKDVVRLGTGLIGTLAALVLGLLISSANSTYETQSTEVKQLTSNIVLLDRTLALYGRETESIRIVLRESVVTLANRIWRENGSDSRKVAPFVESAPAASLYEDILKLSRKMRSSACSRPVQLKPLTMWGKHVCCCLPGPAGQSRCHS